MYKGNGEWVSVPVPKSWDGSSVVFAHEGRCAILMPGEGYEIRDGNIEFFVPPPEGAVISFGSATGMYTSAQALDKITEGIKQLTALVESTRSFVFAKQAEIGEKITQYKKDAEADRERSIERLDEKFKEAVKEAADDIERSLRDDIDDTKRSGEQAQIASDLCVRSVASIETKIKDFNKETDGLLEKCFQAEGAYKDECERLKTIAHEHVRNIEASAIKKCAVMEETFNRLQNSLKKEAGWVSELQDKASSINRRLAEIQDRGGRVIG